MYRTLIISIGLLLPLFSTVGCNVEVAPRPLGETVAASSQSNHIPARAEPVPFVTDPQEGFKIARQESKPMLVFFSLANCANSKRMQETTFYDEEIKRLSRNFVCIAVDGMSAAALCESYNVQGFPTILMLNSQGGELQRLSGRQTAEQLSLQMHIAIQSTAAKVGTTVRK